MEHMKTPESLKLQGNLDKNWKEFKQRLELYMDAFHEGATEKKKTALFLHIAGTEALELYNSMQFEEGEVRDYNTICRKFEEYCSPRKNEVYERHIFRARHQREGKTSEQFIVDLKLLAQTCEYGELTESLIRDQIIEGLLDNKLREKLLREMDLTLGKTERICKIAEVAKIQMRDWNNVKAAGTSSHIDSLRTNTRNIKQKQNKFGTNNTSDRKGNIKCNRCDREHARNKCPAYGKMCNVCKRMGHFAIKCRTSTWKATPNKSASKIDSLEECVEELYIDTVCTKGRGKEEEWWCDVSLEGNNVKFKLDTGAQSNTLPYKIYKKMKNKPDINHEKVVLIGYGEEVVKSYGRINLKISTNEQTSEATFVLVEDDRQPLLGLKTCKELNLVKRVYELVGTDQNSPEVIGITDYEQQIVKKCPKLFSGLGKIQHEYTIQLKDNYTPVVYAARRVPFALKEKFKEAIDKMLKTDVIKKITQPTEWVNPIVLVEKKNGTIRICLDPKALNENIKREHYQLPTRNEIQAELADAKYFTKLDAYSGFYQIPLDEQSQLMCTFGTPMGRYCFKRMPFGIASAPEVFHRTIDQIFEGLDGVKVYIDDLLVWGRTKLEHDNRLMAVIQRAEKAGLTFNKEKCQFGMHEVMFLGDRITSEGMRPDKAKIRDVTEMPPPKDKADVHRAVGLINYIGKYIPMLAEKTTAIRALIREDTTMQWGQKHEEEWAVLKNVLGSAPLLQYYDPSRHIKVSTDASKHGLGAVLLQAYGTEWKPVAYASRSLTPAEVRYAQIEKEALGMVYGCEKFHDYIYGQQFTLETDHKPLTAIIKKEIASLTPRLQRMCIRLLRYQFTMQYTPGKQLILADALSRATPLRSEGSSMEEEIRVHANSIMKNLPVSDPKLIQIRQETAKDSELQEVIDQINNHWTDRAKATVYREHRDQLTLVNGLLIKGTRVVVPRSMRNEMLKRIHEGHLGVEKCKARARQTLYWPHMNTHIEDRVKRCETCQKYQYKAKTQQLMMRETPDFPWYRVGTDLFMFAGNEYVVVIDAHSNYPEVARLPGASSAAVINVLKEVFSRHGIPGEVMSDNGPQYTSREFRDFSEEYGFRHVTSSPHFPRSNGLAEKGVQIVKRILRKAWDSGEDYRVGLMNYRSTPLVDGRSPSQLLMGRNLRTKLPCWNAGATRVRKQVQQNRSNTTLRELVPGEVVRIREGGRWLEKGMVLDKVAPRSYTVVTESENVRRRNREHLNPTKEDYVKELEDVNTNTEGNRETKQPLTLETQGDKTQEVVPLRRSTRHRKPVIRMNL